MWAGDQRFSSPNADRIKDQSLSVQDGALTRLRCSRGADAIHLHEQLGLDTAGGLVLALAAARRADRVDLVLLGGTMVLDNETTTTIRRQPFAKK